MKIFLGADHAGFEIKNGLKKVLQVAGHDVVDFGAHDFRPDDDYPDYVIPVAKAVVSDPESRGIIIGGSGQGEAICANRFCGVRAIVFNGQYRPADGRGTPDEIKMSREHNDANILSLGARFLNLDEAKSAVESWLATPFPGGERHIRRLKKIEDCAKN